MPLNFSAAHSSRVTKRVKPRNSLLKRSASSPFTDFKQRLPIRRSQSKPEAIDCENDFFGDRLDDDGLVKSLAADLSLRDVAQVIHYIHSHMFDSIPESGGLNSTRITKILNFRRSLPPSVTNAHVHALMPLPSSAEREIAELTKAGVVRKLVIPGRGTGCSSTGEGLILSREMERLVKEANKLHESLIGR